MSTPKIGVHFSPEIIAKIGTRDTAGWADALRDWHHNGDQNFNFGRNVSNGKSSEHTWAWHLHFAPDENTSTKAELQRWQQTSNDYHRTSDRLIVYSMAKDQPIKYGILLLAFLDPKGHDLLTSGPGAAERRENWENIAYTHQVSGNMPDGTITEP